MANKNIVPRFTKGQSGNPGGRPKGLENFRELCRAHSEEAVMRLVSIMRGEPQSFLRTETTKRGSVRDRIDRRTPALDYQIKAIEVLLERGYGKPVQPIAGADGESPAPQGAIIQQIIVRVRDDLVDEDGRAITIDHDPDEGTARIQHKTNGSGR